MNNDRLEIPLENGLKLVATPFTDDRMKEIYVFLENGNGGLQQELVSIAGYARREEDPAAPGRHTVLVYVWGEKSEPIRKAYVIDD